MGAGDDCVAVKDWVCAEREYGAARTLEPANAEMAFWHAVALTTGGRLDAAKTLFAQAFAADPRWRELARRLPSVGQLPLDPRVLEAVLAIP
jgi:Flp pilus assembly protein TadD